MKHAAADVLRGELIGARVAIVAARNPSLIGTIGTVLDETKHTLVVGTQSRRRRVLKHQATFTFSSGGKTVCVDGKLLVGRPEDRVKMKIR